MKIQPIKTWKDGQEKFATDLNLSIHYDNLSTSATFEYYLNETFPIESGELIPMHPALQYGKLIIDGDDYIKWGTEIDINKAAYEWAAKKLNLELISE